MATRWEYTILKLPTDYSFFSGTDFDAGQLCQQLDAQGAEGWELVSVFDIEKVKGGSKFVLAVMKRPKD
jgi:phenylalanyl-tRNA synthetase beta subunit